MGDLPARGSAAAGVRAGDTLNDAAQQTFKGVDNVADADRVVDSSGNAEASKMSDNSGSVESKVGSGGKVNGSDIGSYTAPGGGGGVTSTIKINGQTVMFGHGGRHLEGTSLNADSVNQVLANEVSALNLNTGQFHKGQIVVDGITIEYTSFCVSDGIINVGTYYPLE